VAPALEAVAGTLTHLHLEQVVGVPLWRRGDEVEVGYELGVAVGKLRRLKDLALDLSEDGRAYHALPRAWPPVGGTALSPCCGGWGAPEVTEQCRPAGEPAPPECAGLRLDRHFRRPSALLTACALRQAGYKHRGGRRCTIT
jgi:hypothetical protein